MANVFSTNLQIRVWGILSTSVVFRLSPSQNSPRSEKWPSVGQDQNVTSSLVIFSLTVLQRCWMMLIVRKNLNSTKNHFLWRKHLLFFFLYAVIFSFCSQMLNALHAINTLTLSFMPINHVSTQQLSSRHIYPQPQYMLIVTTVYMMRY